MCFIPTNIQKVFCTLRNKEYKKVVFFFVTEIESSYLINGDRIHSTHELDEFSVRDARPTSA